MEKKKICNTTAGNEQNMKSVSVFLFVFAQVSLIFTFLADDTAKYNYHMLFDEIVKQNIGVP